MKSIASTMLALALVASVTGLADDRANYWHNRPNVIRAGQKLATEIEHFDEALHDTHAPTHVIQKVHHFEETGTEFVQMVMAGCSYQQAYSEFNHIRQDMKMIQSEMYAHPHLMQNHKVSSEFWHMRTAYRSLDHEMFNHLRSRWPAEKVEQLKKDLEALEAHNSK